MTQLPARVQRELAFAMANEKEAIKDKEKANLRAQEAEDDLEYLLDELAQWSIALNNRPNTKFTGPAVSDMFAQIYAKHNADE